MPHIESLNLTVSQYLLGCIHSDHIRHFVSLLRCLSYSFHWCPGLVRRYIRTCIYRPGCRYVQFGASSSYAGRLLDLYDMFRSRRLFEFLRIVPLFGHLPRRRNADSKNSVGCFLVIGTEPLLRRIINSHKKDPDTGKVPPEAMVSVVCIAAVLVPVGELWFAWTCVPPVHWIWPILAGIPFGAGNVRTLPR